MTKDNFKSATIKIKSIEESSQENEVLFTFELFYEDKSVGSFTLTLSGSMECSSPLATNLFQKGYSEASSFLSELAAFSKDQAN